MHHATAGLRRALARTAEGLHRVSARTLAPLAAVAPAARRRSGPTRTDLLSETWSRRQHHPRHMARRLSRGRLGAAPGPDLGRALRPLDLGRAVRPVALLAVLVLVVVTAVAWPGVAAVGRTVDPGPSAAPHIAVLRGGLVSLGGSKATEARPAAVSVAIPTAKVTAAGAAAAGATADSDTTGSFLGADAGTVALAVAQTANGVLIRDPVAALGELYPARLLLGPYGPDGELRPAAPLIMSSYTVKSGDTLYTIAAKYGLQFGSLRWANKLTDPRTLHVGQVLRIPPVDGVVYTIKKGDTVESIAASYHVAVDDIVEFNALTTDAPPAGEEIMIPDASGPALPKPAAPVAATGGSSVGTTAHHGKWVWPVPGGRISQYFHASHPALDIAAPKGTRVVAAAPGTVIYAGWGNNGGGYQVWISHGGNLYTTYNHMELVSVRVGQVVKAGQQVGRVGMTGWATGPHCHFEVWIGKVWHGGHRVNPLDYVG